MMSPDNSSELERIYGFGRSVCTMTFGLRGSDTSTPVKFLREKLEIPGDRLSALAQRIVGGRHRLLQCSSGSCRKAGARAPAFDESFERPQAMAFFRKSVRNALFQSGTALILFSFTR